MQFALKKFWPLFFILNNNQFACRLSVKDRGATKSPVSDLELNLSQTATKAIEFYKIKF